MDELSRHAPPDYVIVCARRGLLGKRVKRRFGLVPGSRFTGLDQIPEALIPALAGTRLLALGVYDVFLVVVLFFVGEILLSRLLFRLTIRQRPY